MEKSPHFVRLPLRAMQDGFSQWQIERMIRLAQQLPAEPTGMSKVQLQAWRCSPEGKPWLQVGRKMIEADKIGALYAAFGEAPEDKLPDHVTPPDELTLAEWELWFDDQGRGWPNGWRDIRTILALPSNATSRRKATREQLVDAITTILFNGKSEEAPQDDDELTPEQAAMLNRAAAGLRARRAASNPNPTPAPPGGTPTPEEGTMTDTDQRLAELFANWQRPTLIEGRYWWDPDRWDRRRIEQGKIGFPGILSGQLVFSSLSYLDECQAGDEDGRNKRDHPFDTNEVLDELHLLIRAKFEQSPAFTALEPAEAQLEVQRSVYKLLRGELTLKNLSYQARVEAREDAEALAERIRAAHPKPAKKAAAKRASKRAGNGSKPKPSAPPTPVTIGSGELDPDIAALRSVASKAIERLRFV